MTAPSYRSVCQLTGKKAATDFIAGVEHDGHRPSRAPHAPAHAPCGLDRHHLGRRVMFQQWDTEHGQFVTHTGVVLAHADRTVTIQLDGGGEVWTSCGHVTAAR